jgi:hypothetical protein
MKDKKKIYFLIFTIILGISLIVLEKPYHADKPYYAKRIFKSERAFGDDYFDIYEIKSKKDEKIDGKSIDDNYYKEVKRFKTMMSTYESEIDNYNDLCDSIDSLEKKPNTVYSFEENIDKHGHRTMYIFNSDLGIGYIFDFQI